MKSTLLLITLVLPTFLLARFLEVDPQRQYINSYSYTGNNPANRVDPTGQMDRLPTSLLETIAKGTHKYPTEAINPETKEPFKYRRTLFHAKTDNGTIIEVLGDKLNTAPAKTDCHGITFTGGEFWVEPDQAQRILDNDNYTQVEEPRIGDIAIFRAAVDYPIDTGHMVKAGTFHHSMIVAGKTESGQLLLIGLSGLATKLEVSTPESSFAAPSNIDFYRGTVKERLAVHKVLKRYPYKDRATTSLIKDGINFLKQLRKDERSSKNQ